LLADIAHYLEKIQAFKLEKLSPSQEYFLKLLAENKQLSNYDIEKMLNEASRPMSYKNVFEKNTKLLKKNLIESTPATERKFHPRAKPYTLTAEGIQYVAANIHSIDITKFMKNYPDAMPFKQWVYPLFEDKTLKDATPQLCRSLVQLLNANALALEGIMALAKVDDENLDGNKLRAMSFSARAYFQSCVVLLIIQISRDDKTKQLVCKDRRFMTNFRQFVSQINELEKELLSLKC
jgi:DNA-binding PadR family transcriptional regulator